MDRKLEMVKKELHQGDFSCVIIKNNKLLSSELNGIRPIIDWLKEDKRFFEGTCVADKVIGKAAAMLFVYGGLQYLYTDILSEPAKKVLDEYNIEYYYEKLVPYIINRTKDGRCPMETKVLDINDLEEAYKILVI